MLFTMEMMSCILKGGYKMYQDKAILRSKRFTSERVHAVESFQNSVTQGHTLDVLSDECEQAKKNLISSHYVDLYFVHQDLKDFEKALLSMVGGCI